MIIFHDGKLARRQVDVINRGEHYTVVGSGLVPGEQLVTTPLGAIITGTEAEQVGRKKREQ